MPRLLLFLLIVPAVFAQPAGVTRTFETPCDSVWGVLGSYFASRGLSLQASDRAAGVMTLQWNRGDFAGGFLDQNAYAAVKLLTTIQNYKAAGFSRLRVNSVSFAVQPRSVGCAATIMIEYAGLESRRGWFVLPSNGHLEGTMLEGISAALPALGAIPSSVTVRKDSDEESQADSALDTILADGFDHLIATESDHPAETAKAPAWCGNCERP